MLEQTAKVGAFRLPLRLVRRAFTVDVNGNVLVEKLAASSILQEEEGRHLAELAHKEQKRKRRGLSRLRYQNSKKGMRE